MAKFTLDKNGRISTDPDDNDSNVMASYKFSCSCGEYGTISLKSPKINKLTTKEIILNGSNGPVKCPKCENAITIPGGTFILNEETGEMVRVEE